MRRFVGTVIAAIVVLGSVSAEADVLALYENNNVAALDTSTPVDVTHANLTVGDLSLAASFPASNWPAALTALHNNAGVNSLAAAISSDDYFTFTVTPDAAASVSYTDLFLRSSVGANVQPAETTFSLLSSLTGFTATDVIDSVTSATAAASAVNTGTFDLSGATALQNVAAGTAVEFRVYAHNTGANPMTRVGIGHLFFTGSADDDLRLEGTVTIIPEPTSAALLGFAGLVALFARKLRG